MTQTFTPQTFTPASMPPTLTPCPKCGSEDVKFLNVIHEGGLSNVNTTSRGAGCSPLTIIMFPLIGFWSLLFSSFGNAKTTGTVQTAASLKAAPPERKPIAFSVFLIILGFFLVSSYPVLAIVLMVFGALSAYTAWTYNSRVFPYERQVWEQSAMCQRCGTIYVPNPAGITLEATSTKQILEEQQRKIVISAQPMLTRAQDVGGQVAQKAIQKAEEIRTEAHTEAQRGVAPEQAQTDQAHQPETTEDTGEKL